MPRRRHFNRGDLVYIHPDAARPRLKTWCYIRRVRGDRAYVVSHGFEEWADLVALKHTPQTTVLRFLRRRGLRVKRALELLKEAHDRAMEPL